MTFKLDAVAGVPLLAGNLLAMSKLIRVTVVGQAQRPHASVGYITDGSMEWRLRAYAYTLIIRVEGAC
jgi:hypothetical protein